MNGTSNFSTSATNLSTSKANSSVRLLIATSALVGAIALSSSSAMAQSTVAGNRGAAMIAEGTPLDVVRVVLANTAPDRTDAAARRRGVEEATYVSLNFDNPALKENEPWAGADKELQAFSSTFIRGTKYRKIEDFTVRDMVGAGENVAGYRASTYRSVALGNASRLPLSIHAGVKDGTIASLQFKQDTHAPASLSRQSGNWAVKPNPAAPAFSVVRWR